jgi:hypothetical protein
LQQSTLTVCATDLWLHIQKALLVCVMGSI